jgi:hypothetical protein
MSPKASIFAALLLTFGAGAMPLTAHAYGEGTPDGLPPAAETPPDEGACTHWKDDPVLGSKPYGLCVAYCEAQDCDMEGRGDRQSCQQLVENLRKVTGDPEAVFPCQYEEQPPD